MGTDVLQLVTAALGSLGFSLIFNVRGKTLFWGACWPGEATCFL